MDLTIRKMGEKDLEPLYGLLSDPEVMRYLEAPYTEEQTERFLTKAGLSEPPLVYAVDLGGTFIGYVIFHEYGDRSMEIGWALYPQYWGCGYASRLTELLIRKCAALHRRAVMECVPEQEITKHLALKYGFEYRGRRDGLDVYILDELGSFCAEHEEHVRIRQS